MVGETLDDASGECFDKIAKMLNLGYPGGVYISKTAEKFRSKNPEYKPEFKLPKPLMYSKDFNFSFSGLKTSVLYLIQRLKKSKNFNKKVVEKICTEAEDAITDILVSKTIKLAKSIGAKTIMISGGVSANQRLRDKFEKTINNEFHFICPAKSMSTDNAAMIAIAGYYEHFRRKNDNCLTLEINSNLQI
jgi:N6-L-threonylcarbamoyladenine synthase